MEMEYKRAALEIVCYCNAHSYELGITERMAFDTAVKLLEKMSRVAYATDKIERLQKEGLL